MIFRDTRFRHDLSAEPGLDFTDVKIEQPEKTEFHGTDLGQALFHNTDLSKVDFTLVQWRDRGRVRRYRWRRRWYRLRQFSRIQWHRAWLKRWELLSRLARPRMPRLCLFEEDVALKWAPVLRLPERRVAHRQLSDLLAGTYHQLKRDHSTSADFRTASDWRQLNTNMRRLYGGFGWAWVKLAWDLQLLRVFSAALRRSETVTLRDPVMPVLDGLPRCFINADGFQLREWHGEIPTAPARHDEHVS